MVTASVVEHGPAVSVSGFRPKTPQELLSCLAFEQSVTYVHGLLYIVLSSPTHALGNTTHTRSSSPTPSARTPLCVWLQLV